MLKLLGRLLLWLGLLAYFGGGLAYLGLRYYLWPQLDQWRPQIVARLSHELGRPIAIERLRTGFRGLQPELRIDGFELRDTDGNPQLRADSAIATVSPLRLLSGLPELSSLVLESPRLTVEHFGAGQWRVAGFDLHEQSEAGDGRGLDALLSQPRIEIRNGRVELIDRVDDSQVVMSGLALAMERSGLQYRAVLNLPQAGVARQLRAAARFASPLLSRPGDWRSWRGEAFVGADHVDGPTVAALKRLAIMHATPVGTAASPLSVQNGDFLFWTRFADGKPIDGLLKFEARKVNWRFDGRSGEESAVSSAPSAPSAPATTTAAGSAVASGSSVASAAGVAAAATPTEFDELTAVGRVAAVRGQVLATPDEAGGFRFEMPALDITLRPDVHLTAQGASEVRLHATGQIRQARLSIEPFDVAPLLAWARDQAWPADGQARLRQAVASGRVGKLQVAIERPATPTATPTATSTGTSTGTSTATPTDASIRPAPLRYSGEFGFEQLSLAQRDPLLRRAADGSQLPSLPAFERLSGAGRFSEVGGQLEVRGDKGATLIFPGLFALPRIGLDLLDGKLNWAIAPAGGAPAPITAAAAASAAAATNVPEPSANPASPPRRAVTLQIEQFRFANSDMTGSVSGVYQTGGRGAGLVDLKGGLERAKATSVARYLPLHLHESVRTWISDSILAGGSRDVKFRLKGDLHDFPFHLPGQRGEFQVAVKLTDGKLDFAKDWPTVDDITASLLFDRNSMDITLDAGTMAGVPVNGVKIAIADYQESLLAIDGNSKAAAGKLIGLVNTSPLKEHSDGLLTDTKADGDVGVALKLRIPLHDLPATQFTSSLRLQNNSIVPQPGWPAFTAVNGQVDITEHGVTAREMHGNFLGGPITLEASTPQAGRVQVKARGVVSLDDVRSLADNPITHQLEGRTDYRVTVDTSHQGTRLRVDSDLTGLVSKLPPPFAKPAGVAWPLSVTSGPSPVASEGVVTAINLRDDVKILIGRRADPATGKLLIERAAFALNAEPVFPEKGLSVSLNLPRVDFDAWGSQLPTRTAGGAEQPLGSDFAPDFSLVPTQVSVLARDLVVGGKELHDVVFGASRREGLWRANVSAREVEGFFSWRDAPPGQPLGLLTARFTRLEIPQSRQKEIESLIEPDRTDLPALDVTADEFVLGSRRLGRLKLLANNGSEGGLPRWNLKELRIEHPAGTLAASGVWGAASKSGARTTALDFTLDIQDSGVLLTDFGIKDALRGGAGSIAGKVAWGASPISMDYPTLDGTLHIALGKGQFMKTEPGIAKLIGVLNLQSLPKRLSLDFSDVFADGFVFDDIAGDVQINRGVAHADALRMNGVQARVQLTGEADLAHETQSLDVVVRPNLNAGLASLAYAAINPVIGLGSFLAQVALRKPLEDVFTLEYKVSGSWVAPQVVEKSRSVDNRQPAPP